MSNDNQSETLSKKSDNVTIGTATAETKTEQTKMKDQLEIHLTDSQAAVEKKEIDELTQRDAALSRKDDDGETDHVVNDVDALGSLSEATAESDSVKDSDRAEPVMKSERRSPEKPLLLDDLGLADEGAAWSSSTPGPSSVSPPSPQQSVYHIKWVKWKDRKTAIITQNENGPCPLIAIMNVLVLKGKVNLPPMIEMITADQLMEYLGDCILQNAPKNISEGAQLNYEQNMHDAMSVFPKLQTGLDVNVKFTGIKDFEYTPECIIFDLLNIPLCHGWLVDPQIPLDVMSVGNSSYNQLVERIIQDKCSADQDVVFRALNAESFLDKTASQLTYHGLCELNAAVQDGELCVMFRNNHFSTIYKYKTELFQLVTDQGFLTESCVVWETLSSIDGDGQFVDGSFAVVPPRSAVCSGTSEPASSVQQVDQDYLVALSLQEEQQRHVEQEVAWQEYKEKQLGIVDTVTDEELARRLQQQEQAHQSSADQQPAQRPQAVGGSSTSTERHESKKKSDCTIL